MALKMFAASLFACAIVGAPALAQEMPAGGLGQLCKAELGAVCAPSPDGKMGGIRCLFEKEADLGPECGAAVKVVKERRDRLRAACKEDADKLCQGADSKVAPIVQCLRAKQAELSKACADMIASLPAPPAK